MKKIRIEKITLNVGAGKDQGRLEKGIILLKNLTGIAPVKTTTKKRIPGWGLRPGLAIGCKLTLRGKKAEEILDRLLEAKERVLKAVQFDNSGNLSFGVHEYIDIPGMEYEPKIGIMGLEVCVTFDKPGYRVKKRFTKKSKIGKSHIIKKEESIDYIKNNFKVQIGEN